MTYSSSGPSLAQAPVVDPSLSSSSIDSSSSSSSSTTSSHSHIHSNSYPPHARSIGKRHAHVHRYEETQGQDQDNTRRNIESSSRLRHSHLRRAQTSEAKSLPKLDIRDDTTGYVTQVVQTVSLVQVVDSTGSPIAVQTLYGTPNTIVVDSASGSTISVSNPESSTTAVPASNPASTDDVAQSSTDMTYIQSYTPSAGATSSGVDALYATPAATTSYTVDLDSQDSAVTPGHNGTSSALSTGTPVSSSTTLTDTSLFSTATESTASESTTDASMYLEMISSSTTESSTSSTSFSSSSTTLSSTTDSSSFSSTIYSYSTETWISTQYGDDQGGDGGNYGIATASGTSVNPTSTSSADSSSGTLSTQQKQVIGGVVGSIAGVAIVALLFLLAVKYKKKQGGHALLGEGPAGTHSHVKGLITNGDGSGGAAMTQRSGPFAVAATLAGLSAKRGSQPPPVNTSERGFYRVSGKKLPSVLHNGGDGYTSPQEPMPDNSNRDSVASGHTDYWRGSMAFDPSEAGGSARLALGSPMRPVSGVPVIRTGPARTPVTEENPFADPVPRPRPDSDALGDSVGGGSIYSQDGSWSSPSRFQERI